jgi:hypothetical protein
MEQSALRNLRVGKNIEKYAVRYHQALARRHTWLHLPPYARAHTARARKAVNTACFSNFRFGGAETGSTADRDWFAECPFDDIRNASGYQFKNMPEGALLVVLNCMNIESPRFEGS